MKEKNLFILILITILFDIQSFYHTQVAAHHYLSQKLEMDLAAS